MTPDDYNLLQMELCRKSNALLQEIGLSPYEAFNLMLREPEILMCWWAGAFEQSETDHAAIRSAAKAIAAGAPLPELTIQQRARLALRLRLGAQIVRAISSRHHLQPKGWFPNKLRRMSEHDLVEWVLLDGWHFVAEVFDEGLRWAGEVEPPTPPSTRRSPPASLSQDSSTICE